MKIKKHIVNNRHVYRHLRGKSDFVVDIATPEQVDLARRLQADIYLHYNNISPRQVTEQGFLNFSTDPYHKNSVYFVAFNKKTPNILAGSVRLILPAKGYTSLQISLEVPKEAVTQKLQGIKENRYAEISGLVKQLYAPSIIPLLLLRTCYHYSLENSIEHLFMTVTEEPYQKFRAMFGESMIVLGEPFNIPHGHNTVHPIAIQTKSLQKTLGSKKSKSLKNHIAHRVLL